MTRWPHDDPASLKAFYGDPAKGEPGQQLMPVVPPFRMTYDGKPIKSIMFHRKAAPALAAALNAIWEHCGRDQRKIDAISVSKYSGAYNPRFIRGSTTKWSNHAFGAAIDFDAEHNGFNTGHGIMPQAVVDAFKAQGALWGGDYRGRTDPMHFEFCSRDAAPLGFADVPQTDGDSDAGTEEIDDLPAGVAPQGSFWKLIKSKIAWASSALGGISITSVLGFLTDYRVILAIGVIGLVAYIIYERNRKP
jgi:hypothetical protein